MGLCHNTNKHSIVPMDTQTSSQCLRKGIILRSRTARYEIIRTLGQGSFGITYLAAMHTDGSDDNLTATVYVAVKEFFMQSINGRNGTMVTASDNTGMFEYHKKKFLQEAMKLKNLNHPNIIKVAEAFEFNGTSYYAMEYIDGTSLRGLIDSYGRMSEDAALGITNQIGSALSYMHSKGMLHLDVKPANVMMRDGEAVLIDFGLSKQYDTDGNPMTHTSIDGGTPGYAPLEQSNYHEHNGLPVTLDIYALGATLMKMLTGINPMPTASEILNSGFPRKLFSDIGVSKHTTACVEKAMAPLCKDRYQTVNGFLDAINKGRRSDKLTITIDRTLIKKWGKKAASITAIIAVAAVVIYGCGLFAGDVVTGIRNALTANESVSTNTLGTDTHAQAPPRKVSYSSPQAIDLGLPSRTVWADRNLGAPDPETDGDLFAFGATVSRDEYPKTTGDEFVDGEIIIGTDRDAATKHLGETWQMPSKAQFEELKKYCKWEKTAKGCKLTGPNGNTMFLPYHKQNKGIGYYAGGEKGVVMEFHKNYQLSDDKIHDNFSTYCPHSIRPVRKIKSHAAYGIKPQKSNAATNSGTRNSKRNGVSGKKKEDKDTQYLDIYESREV